MIVDIGKLVSQTDKLSPSTREKLFGLVGNLVDHKGKININIYITKLTEIIKIIKTVIIF